MQCDGEGEKSCMHRPHLQHNLFYLYVRHTGITFASTMYLHILLYVHRAGRLRINHWLLVRSTTPLYIYSQNNIWSDRTNMREYNTHTHTWNPSCRNSRMRHIEKSITVEIVVEKTSHFSLRRDFLFIVLLKNIKMCVH